MQVLDPFFHIKINFVMVGERSIVLCTRLMKIMCAVKFSQYRNQTRSKFIDRSTG